VAAAALLIVLGAAVPDAAPAGAEYVRGLRLLEEKKYEEAIRAFEEAVKHEAAENPSLKYRDPNGRHRHPYFPYYEIARARMELTRGEASPFVRRERLLASVRSLAQTAHPDGPARLAEAKALLEEAEKAVAEVEASTPPPEVVQLRAKTDRLCEGQKFEEALGEIEAAGALFQRFERLKAEMLAAVRNRQKAALQGYDVILSSRLESTSRTDPTFEAEMLLPLLKPARVPPEVTRDPAPRFRWLEEFLALYERELDRVRTAATLPPAELLASAAGFDRLAEKALEIDLGVGFRASRNIGRSMRLARLKEMASLAERPDSDLPGSAEFQKESMELLTASAETAVKVEQALQERLRNQTVPPQDLKKYLEVDLPYHRRQTEAVRGKLREVLIAYERRVAAEAAARTAQDGLSAPGVMVDPSACRKLAQPLSVLEAQPYFETLPAPVRAHVLFARALCEATAGFLDAESPARVAERCKADLARAHALDPQVETPWKESGRLSPRIAKVFDRLRP
jgi:hypothetical protein